MEAWTRFGSDVLQRVPDLAQDARRLADFARAPTKIASEVHEAWLEGVGGVSRERYLAVLEENLELRRRIEELERSEPFAQLPPNAPSEAMDGAFRQLRDAQEQWLSLWMPKKGEPADG